jgi:hypothetical protein
MNVHGIFERAVGRCHIDAATIIVSGQADFAIKLPAPARATPVESEN